MRRYYIGVASGILALMVWLGLASPACGGVVSFNDPFAAQQWYLDRMHFGEAWDLLTQQGALGQVTVAVIDSGFDTTHVDLSDNLVAGINIVDGSGDVSPVHPHGTATGGLPGAVSGNAIGISQAALTSKVLPIRVSNRSDGGAYLSDIAAGIRYAADHGSRVINISYSGVESPVLEAAAAYANAKGAVVFMAAGNDGMNQRRWKNHKYLVAIGSYAQSGRLSWFSNRGQFVDFAAPGEAITTLLPNGQYASWSGTSFASPLASSVAALMLTANPDLAPWEVRKILRDTAVGPRTRWVKRHGKWRLKVNQRNGWGRIDALAAVERALEVQGKWGAINDETGDNPTVTVDWSNFSGMQHTEGWGTGKLAYLEGYLSGSAAPIPEPGGWLILLAGLPVALSRGRRRAR
jgi:subtilisin family serine protease